MPNAGQVQWHQFARSGSWSEIGLRKNTLAIPTFVHQELLRLQAIHCNLLMLPSVRRRQAPGNERGRMQMVN